MKTNKNVFVGRAFELSQLQSLDRLQVASMVVVRGRRRIGKSRLIQEFGRTRKFYEFSGLFPKKETTSVSQKLEFATQYKQIFGRALSDISDWSAMFAQLASEITKDKALLLFDEISWMGSLDPDFVGKLKIAWDLYFSKNKKLILVLCGSISWWLEEHILQNTEFYGRVNLTIDLTELSLSESCLYLRARKPDFSISEITKILSVVGGVPRYLELIDTSLSAEDNIKNLCFQKEAILLKEYDRIFNEIFGKRSESFEKVARVLLQKSLNLAQVADKLNLSISSNIIHQLEMLKTAGFVEIDSTWDLKTGKISRFKEYRLKDNYLRFYLKYLAPNRALINKGAFQFQSLYQLPGLEAIMGLQFENLILNARDVVLQRLGVEKSDVRFDGPYFQRQTKRRSGCQIDYLIQTKQRNVYICEIKASRDPVTKQIIKELAGKFKAIKKHFNTSYRFVLISAGPVNNSVSDSGFFDRIVTMEELLS